jgi:hypothetical protein
MKEKSTIEILSEFAKRKGIKCHTSANYKNYLLSSFERYSSTKFVVFDLQDTDNKTFMVFFDSFASKAYTGTTYCGMFKMVKECRHEVKIQRRDWFDVLSFKKRVKTGSRLIDRNVSVFSESKELDRSIVNSEIIKRYLEISKRIKPLELATLKDSESLVPELHGNNLIALTTNSWIWDTKDLEYFIERGILLFRKIS